MPQSSNADAAGFNYSKFFNDIAVMQFFMGVANLISASIEISQPFGGNYLIFMCFGVSISGYLTLYSFYPCCRVKRPEKLRKQLNKYCGVVCFLSTIQFSLYLINSIMTRWTVFSFWISFCTTITSYLVIFYFYLCTKAAKKPEYVRPGVYPGITPVQPTIPQTRPTAPPSVIPTAPALDEINSRADETPSYNDVIHMDPPKYISSVLDDPPPPPEGLPPPPCYTDAIRN